MPTPEPRPPHRPDPADERAPDDDAIEPFDDTDATEPEWAAHRHAREIADDELDREREGDAVEENEHRRARADDHGVDGGIDQLEPLEPDDQVNHTANANSATGLEDDQDRAPRQGDAAREDVEPRMPRTSPFEPDDDEPKALPPASRDVH